MKTKNKYNMKKYLTLTAALIGFAFNSVATVPDTIDCRLDVVINKYKIRAFNKSANHTIRIVNNNGDTQGRVFVYRDKKFVVNVYYYYGIGITRIDGTVKKDSIVVDSNHKLIINGVKTKAKFSYVFYNYKGVAEEYHLGDTK